ncbi:MAG: hypothetical protein KKG93_12030 [Bacteroidetes bacterium]|nr:hypothetical protein [Bacteroidota bacterium]
MNQRISIVTEPEKLSHAWDNLAANYFQRRNFISYMHQYNYCNQRYYELYKDQKLKACGVVYTLKIDLFTFSKYRCPVEMKVIGLPVSLAAGGIFGDPEELEYLIIQILQREIGGQVDADCCFMSTKILILVNY